MAANAAQALGDPIGGGRLSFPTCGGDQGRLGLGAAAIIGGGERGALGRNVKLVTSLSRNTELV